MFAPIMRPQDFKYPFKSPITACTLVDRMVFVPQKPFEKETGSLPFSSLFESSRPLHVEYCSGNGAWIAEKAKQFPDLNWVAVEKKFDRARKIWAKVKNGHLNNLLIVCGEAHLTTKLLFPSESISKAYINFPDPWPKKRHWKHRLLAVPFLGELHRALKVGSAVSFVTDDAPYSEYAITQVKSTSGFASLYPDPYFLSEDASYGSSYFEELWRSQGRQVRYHLFGKKP